MAPEDRLKPPPVDQRTGLGYPDRRVGLGDVVKQMARPVAWTIKAVGGKDFQGCGGCKARQQKLNNMIPNVLNPLNRK